MFRLRAHLKVWREKSAVSFVLSRAVRPIYRAANTIVGWVPWLVRVNGGTVNFDGHKLVFPANVGVTYCTLGWWYGAAGYEPATWKAIQAYVRRSDVFWDVGSNIGLYAVLAKKTKPALRVEAFEPVPSLAEASRKFQEANGSGVMTRQVAVSSHANGAEITVRKYADVTEVEPTSTLEKDVNLSLGASAEVLKVETTTLDLLAGTLGPADQLFIKIDVEGHENHVLKGARTLLKIRRPIILCEILPGVGKTEEIAAILSEAGYAVLAISREGLFAVSAADLSKKRNYTDYLLIPEEKVRGSGNYFGFNELPE
jgi:FkbM family methyltransferase